MAMDNTIQATSINLMSFEITEEDKRESYRKLLKFQRQARIAALNHAVNIATSLKGKINNCGEVIEMANGFYKWLIKTDNGE